MIENISAFDEFIFKSAEKYLQTVVLVDDRIYESTSGSIRGGLAKPTSGLRKPALKSIAIDSDTKNVADKTVKDAERPDEISFHEVQNSFAKKHIICSLYQPKKDAIFSERSDTYNLCSAADVIIVDWDLHGDFGNKATSLVGALIEQSMKEIPHQLRLILIYTLEVNLRSVADRIYDDLVERIGKEPIDVNDSATGLVLTTDNARIVVLGKREDTSLPEYADFRVPEKKLAEKTIEEFARLASGLLQAVVLRGMAYLRENNRRILMRFHEDLDAAFLIHRILLLPDETFGQIIPLLSDELRAVLEDKIGEYPLGRGLALDRIVAGWCEKRWRAGNEGKFVIGKGADALEFAKDLFCNGPAIKKDYSAFQGNQIDGLVEKDENSAPKWKQSKTSKRIDLAEYLSSNCAGDSHHEKLSSLMSQRIAYDNALRALHLGVILKEVDRKGRYMICLQPVCDSVRMDGKTRAFVFCILDAPKENDSFNQIVMDLSGNLIRLDFKPKVFNCYISNFTSRTDAVYTAKEDNGQYIFQDDNGYKYEWIAELKTEHAQRAAEEFGRALSRVGLTESEWSRLKGK